MHFYVDILLNSRKIVEQIRNVNSVPLAFRRTLYMFAVKKKKKKQSSVRKSIRLFIDSTRFYVVGFKIELAPVYAWIYNHPCTTV